jgi:threonine synthase
VSVGSSFARHADWLWSSRLVADDVVFRKLVGLVASRVEEVDGRPVSDTPLVRADALAEAIGFSGELWVKNDTVNVSGSHKVRHLIGLALHALAADPGDVRPLAIASCGNAALAAAVVAQAIKRDLLVFIPPVAPPTVVARLVALGAHITVCPRRPGDRGDPCFLRFEEVIASGEAVAFCCQGTVAPNTFDGGRTISWEIVEQLAMATGESVPRIDRVFVQVGGGALATSTHMGMGIMFQHELLESVPALHAVQTTGAAPLERAYSLLRAEMERIGVDAAFAEASHEPARFMWPWETEPRSIASGILDDITYDWLPVVHAMVDTAGWPIVVDEATLIEANALARRHTGIAVDHTGTAGLAGLLHELRRDPSAWPDDRIVVLFTGEDRG